MSDMVIFISSGKKARFHAVDAFILLADDKGSNERERERKETRKGRQRDRRRVKRKGKGDRKRKKIEKVIKEKGGKTLKLWAELFKEPTVHAWEYKQCPSFLSLLSLPLSRSVLTSELPTTLSLLSYLPVSGIQACSTIR